mgnify:CR=1 FL=1
MRKCPSADRYQAKRAPRCNGGKGCFVCYDKWTAELVRREYAKIPKGKR